MKAVVTQRYGGPETLRLADVPTPEPTDRQLLVRVLAGSVNPVDWKVRRGELRFVSGLLRPPAVLGADFAGVVEAAGARVQGYAPGDRVFGMLRAFEGGANAEYLLAEAHNLAPAPSRLTPTEAACLPLVGLTVWQLFEQRLRPAAGQRLLVNGCTGGLGHVAVQWAKALELHVTGVCSPKNAALAAELGADRVVDYTRAPLEELRDDPFDVIFDAAATLRFARVRHMLTPSGAFVSSIPSPRNVCWSPLVNLTRRQRETYLWVRPSHAGLRRVAELADAGKLKPHLGLVLPLRRLAEAHARSEAGGVAGKIAIEVA